MQSFSLNYNAAFLHSWSTVSYCHLAVLISNVHEIKNCIPFPLCLCNRAALLDSHYLLCCMFFLAECVGLFATPKEAWCCRYCENRQQRESCLAYNNNAIAAGRIEGADPLEEIFKRSIRIATLETGFGGCALCK